MQQDCVVVGASFAGLACATALAGAGARVTVLERKHDPGVKLHTTGILVRDLVEQLPLLDGLPPEMVRRVNGVRLYAPNMSSVDLAAPGARPSALLHRPQANARVHRLGGPRRRGLAGGPGAPPA